ncbi:MAG: dipeptidase, partial [Bacteroidales bacterium]|nr:dipeptidase [Bacteroidales bacterium]
SAVDYLTKTCCDLGSDLVKQRKVLFQNLFMKYMDGNVKTTDDDFRFKTDPDTPDIPALTQPGYGQDWQDDVARKTGDKLKIEN